MTFLKIDQYFINSEEILWIYVCKKNKSIDIILKNPYKTITVTSKSEQEFEEDLINISQTLT